MKRLIETTLSVLLALMIVQTIFAYKQGYLLQNISDLRLSIMDAFGQSDRQTEIEKKQSRELNKEKREISEKISNAISDLKIVRKTNSQEKLVPIETIDVDPDPETIDISRSEMDTILRTRNNNEVVSSIKIFQQMEESKQIEILQSIFFNASEPSNDDRQIIYYLKYFGPIKHIALEEKLDESLNNTLNEMEQGKLKSYNLVEYYLSLSRYVLQDADLSFSYIKRYYLLKKGPDALVNFKLAPLSKNRKNISFLNDEFINAANTSHFGDLLKRYQYEHEGQIFLLSLKARSEKLEIGDEILEALKSFENSLQRGYSKVDEIDILKGKSIFELFQAANTIPKMPATYDSKLLSKQVYFQLIENSLFGEPVIVGPLTLTAGAMNVKSEIQNKIFFLKVDSTQDTSADFVFNFKNSKGFILEQIAIEDAWVFKQENYQVIGLPIPETNQTIHSVSFKIVINENKSNEAVLYYAKYAYNTLMGENNPADMKPLGMVKEPLENDKITKYTNMLGKCSRTPNINQTIYLSSKSPKEYRLITADCLDWGGDGSYGSFFQEISEYNGSTNTIIYSKAFDSGNGFYVLGINDINNNGEPEFYVSEMGGLSSSESIYTLESREFAKIFYLNSQSEGYVNVWGNHQNPFLISDI